jgi:hypothetical protein
MLPGNRQRPGTLSQIAYEMSINPIVPAKAAKEAATEASQAYQQEQATARMVRDL